MGFLEQVVRNMIYKVEVKCTNCHHKETVSIMKGVEVKDGLKRKSCSYCGTHNLIPIVY